MSLWLIIPFVYTLSLQKFRRNILDFFRTVSIHNLSFPVRATVMRIYPKRAIDDVCMRLEIYGCLGKRPDVQFFFKFKQSKRRFLQGREREIDQGSHSLYEVVSILRVLSLSLFSRIPWKSIATDCSAQRDKGNLLLHNKKQQILKYRYEKQYVCFTLPDLLLTFKIYRTKLSISFGSRAREASFAHLSLVKQQSNQTLKVC